jgi:hypothetical protein
VGEHYRYRLKEWPLASMIRGAVEARLEAQGSAHCLASYR